MVRSWDAWKWPKTHWSRHSRRSFGWTWEWPDCGWPGVAGGIPGAVFLPLHGGILRALTKAAATGSRPAGIRGDPWHESLCANQSSQFTQCQIGRLLHPTGRQGSLATADARSAGLRNGDLGALLPGRGPWVAHFENSPPIHESPTVLVPARLTDTNFSGYASLRVLPWLYPPPCPRKIPPAVQGRTSACEISLTFCDHGDQAAQRRSLGGEGWDERLPISSRLIERLCL